MEYQFELPESSSKFPLAVSLTYSHGYVSTLLSPSIPPSRPRPDSTSLFVFRFALVLFGAVF